jgi:hypothetical protein
MQKLKSQKGFVALEVVLVVLLLAAIGVAGYFAYKDHTNKSNTTPVSSSASSSKPKTTANPTPSAAANVFQIPELGVQMTLPSGLSKSDIYYVATSTPSTYQDDNGKTLHNLGEVVLSTHSLVAQEPYCAPGIPGSGSGFQGLIEFDKSEENGQSYVFSSGNTHYEPVGNFYMSIADRQAPCSTTSDTSLENTQYSLFQQAFSTLTPIK